MRKAIAKDHALFEAAFRYVAEHFNYDMHEKQIWDLAMGACLAMNEIMNEIMEEEKS